MHISLNSVNVARALTEPDDNRRAAWITPLPNREREDRADHAKRKPCEHITRVMRVKGNARECESTSKWQRDPPHSRTRQRNDHRYRGECGRVPAWHAVEVVADREGREIESVSFEQKFGARLSNEILERGRKQSTHSDRDKHCERPARDVVPLAQGCRKEEKDRRRNPVAGLATLSGPFQNTQIRKIVCKRSTAWPRERARVARQRRATGFG